MSTPLASAAPAGATGRFPWPYDPQRHSGPAVARAFQCAFGLVLVSAWVSLASQVQLLIGRRGLLPAAELFARLSQLGVGFWDMPSLLWLAHGDFVLRAGCVLGALLGLLALLGVHARTCFALSAPLYLSYATACSDFTAFQWDNMLVEVALLAACLPADRPSRLPHFAFRALLFKLYFESGIAKWQSHLHDWQDGSAMQFYYETAPLPAGLAFAAHHLPAWWHRLESRGALVLELLVPLLIFGPRWARLAAFAAFTGFQIVNTATANYGFFTYLSLVLHLFLLSDSDVLRARGWLTRRLRLPPPRPLPVPRASRVPRILPAALLGVWLAASLLAALGAFSRVAPALGELEALYAPLRVANVYHLFGHITRERIEPQFQTRIADHWTEHDLRYKPGAVHRRPPYVAPHQPRVDFRLWFYGLSFRQGMPRYVSALLDRLCHDPEAVQPLFAGGLPRAPDAVRIAFYRYRFASAQAHAQDGAYFEREQLGALPRGAADERAQEAAMRLARWFAIALALWGALLSYLLFAGRVPAAWLPEPARSAPAAHDQASPAKTAPADDETALDEAAPDEATPAPPPSSALPAARYAVCAREEAPPLLSSVRLTKDGPALWALHCGPSVHLLSIEREGDALVAQRVLRARVPARSPAEAPRPARVRAGDIDGDGRGDLIVPALFTDRSAAPAAGTLALLRQRAEGGFEAPRRVFDVAIGDVAPAALDAQPGQDLALLHLLDARNARSNELWLVHGGPAPLRYAQMPAGVGADALCAADLDRDGLDDVVAASEHEQRVRIWLSSRSADAQAESIALDAPGVREVIAGDVDGDGKPDVVLNGASVSLLLAGKDFRAEPIALPDSAGLRDVQLEDVNGDGKLDVVGYAHPNLIALQQGPGLAFTRSTLATLRGDFGVLFARAAQLDDDGRIDLVLILLSNAADAAIELAVARDLHDGLAVEPAGHVEAARDAALAEHFELP